MEKAITFLSFAVSIITLLFVYRQVKDASKATKSQIATGLIDQLYADMQVARFFVESCGSPGFQFTQL